MRAARLLSLAVALFAGPCAAAAGVVLGPDGAPVAGATVTRYAAESSRERLLRVSAGRARAPLASVVTGADGAFTLPPSAAPGDVAVVAKGFAPSFVDGAGARGGTIVLQAARGRKGAVTAQGRPVAGARVVFLDGDGRGEWMVETAADGSYEAPDPSAWAGWQMVFHPSFVLFAREGGWGAGAKALDVTLDPGVALEGRVVDGRRQPVPGAEVWIGGGHEPWPAAVSGADGQFRVAHAPREWDVVLARTGTLAGRAVRGTAPLVVVANPAREVTGTVRDLKGAPLPGARVSLLGGEGAPFAVTDAQGRYALVAIAPGTYTLFAARAGYVDTRVDRGEFVLRAAGPAGRDFILTPLPVLDGRVEDEARRPVAGALVTFGLQGVPHLYAPDPYRGMDLGGGGTRTSSDGTFSLALPYSGPPAGWAAEMAPRPLVVLKTGFAAARVRLSEPPARPRAPLVVTLLRGVELRGRTVDASGAPLAGVAITAAEDGPGDVRYPGALLLGSVSGDGWVTSGSDGRFSLRVHPVAHDVRAHKQGFVARLVRGHDPRGDALEIVMDRSSALRGRVVRADGTPVGEVAVALQPGQPLLSPPAGTATAADGTFVVDDVSPGPYTLSASLAALGLTETRAVEVPGPDVEVRLGPTGTVSGRVTDAATHQPLQRFDLLFTWSQELAAGQRAVPVVDATGRFTVSDLPAVALSLVVNADGHAPATLEEVTAAKGDAGSPLEVALQPEAIVQGRVVDEAQAPLANVGVTATGVGRSGDEGQSDETDGEGRFEIHGVAAGELRIAFEATGFVSETRTVDARTAARVDVTLRRGLALSGVVTAEGAPAPGASLYVGSADGEGSQTAESDEAGRFRVTGLVPGRYTVQASGMKGHAQLEDVDPQTAGPLQLVLVMPKTAVLTGRLAGAGAAEEIVYPIVQAMGQDGRSAAAPADASLAFRMADAPAGPITVTAHVMDARGMRRSSRPLDLVLAAGSETDVTLEFASGSVSGQVTRDGGPVAGVVVSFTSGRRGGATGRTDAGGRYVVAGLDPGPYTVTVSGDGHTNYTTEYTVAGSDELDIDVTGTALQGRVVRADGGAPVPGVEVTLWPLFGGSQNSPAQTATTGEQGEFSLRALHEGRYRLTTSKPGFGQDVRELDLERGAAGQVQIELTPAAGITVTVVDQRTGRPLEGIVVVRDAARHIVANRHSGVGADGALNIPLADGAYILSVSASGFGTVTRPVTAPSTGLRVALTPGGTLVIESTRLVEGRVRLLQPDGEEYVRCWCNGIATIDLTGRRTTVEHVASGGYTMEVLVGQEVVARQPVAIAEGQKATVTID